MYDCNIKNAYIEKLDAIIDNDEDPQFKVGDHVKI